MLPSNAINSRLLIDSPPKPASIWRLSLIRCMAQADRRHVSVGSRAVILALSVDWMASVCRLQKLAEEMATRGSRKGDGEVG